VHDAETLCFVCGPTAMVDEMPRLLEEIGVPRATLAALKGGDADANALALSGVLNGKPSPYRDVALLNAAATLIVAGRAKDLKEGVAIGTKSIDSGAAAARLKHLIAVSNG